MDAFALFLLRRLARIVLRSVSLGAGSGSELVLSAKIREGVTSSRVMSVNVRGTAPATALSHTPCHALSAT